MSARNLIPVFSSLIDDTNKSLEVWIISVSFALVVAAIFLEY